jgi:hypothetical protein
MKESSLVERILKTLNSIPKCKAIKRHGSAYGRRGEPDITGSFCGLHFELEVKVPGGKLTKLQELRLKEWEKSGAIVSVVYSVDDAVKLLNKKLINNF